MMPFMHVFPWVNAGGGYSNSYDPRSNCSSAPVLIPTTEQPGNDNAILYPYGANISIFHPSFCYPLPFSFTHNCRTKKGLEAHNQDQTSDLPDSVLSSTKETPSFGPGPPIITGHQLKGPKGCNLFVFHLPNEITNWDLYVLFRRFGTLLSVHIMVNRVTGLSKGYGFVSFANNCDAIQAIEYMNGFRLGKKRLKVQHKRFQDDVQDDHSEESTQLQPGPHANWNAQSMRYCSDEKETISTDSQASPLPYLSAQQLNAHQKQRSGMTYLNPSSCHV